MDLPNHGIAWCGEDIYMAFFFVDPGHVLNYLAGGAGASTPCKRCLRELRKVINTELGVADEG